MTRSHSDLRPRRVVIYARISDDREGRRYGVDRQVKDCRRLAERNGDEVVAVFIDDDRSAYGGKPRPEYLKMLQYLRDGNAEGILALIPTRLYRRLEDGLEFFKLINAHDLEVETVKSGRFNLSTADGRRDALRAAIDAQHESELIGERVRDAKADNVARGEYRGGPRPFGYESDGVTPRSLLCLTAGCPGEEFDVDRKCLDCGAGAVNKPDTEIWEIERGLLGVANGESLRSLFRAANGAGLRTAERRYKQADGSRGEPESRDWDDSSYRRMLQRPRNAGLLEVAGEVVGRAQWAPAAPEELWRAAVAVLEDPSRRMSFSNNRVWLVPGLAKCYCGSVVKVSSVGAGMSTRKDPDNPDGPPIKVKRAGHVPAYRCRETGGHVARRAAALDAYIEGLVIERLSRADAAELFLPPALRRSDEEDLGALMKGLRAKLKSISDDYGHDRITRAQMTDMTAVTRGRMEQAEAKMAARVSTSVLASVPLGSEELGAEWQGYDIDRKRAIISAVMEIVIHPAKRGRPSAKRSDADPAAEGIEITWKTPGAE